jgi:hypothetical protein
MYQTKKYLIIPTSTVNDINFAEVYETSINTLRYSVDGTKTFIKYDVMIYEEDTTEIVINAETGEEIIKIIPAGTYGRPSIYNPSYPEYFQEEMLVILGTEEWTVPIISSSFGV